VDLRPLIGDWIFGCDLCLEVCPWNRFATMGREARFQARDDRAAPALLPLLHLSREEFRLKFNGSPIQRARRDGFVRNVAVALGNVGGPEAVDPLALALRDDPSPLVRGHAAWALGRLGRRLSTGDSGRDLEDRILNLLRHAAGGEVDRWVLSEIEAASLEVADVPRGAGTQAHGRKP
jgi:epoxyqueuosine reductase